MKRARCSARHTRTASFDQPWRRARQLVSSQQELVAVLVRRDCWPALPFGKAVVARIGTCQHYFRIALNHGLHRHCRRQILQIVEDVLSTTNCNQLAHVVLAIYRVERPRRDLVENADRFGILVRFP